MRDFEHKKRQILDRIDILQVVSEHVRLKRNGQRWIGLCCFHSEKTPSFTVNPEQGFFKCFGCGKGGDLFSFVQMRENIGFAEAMQLLADRAGVELKSGDTNRNPGEISRNDLAKVNAWAVEYFRCNLNDPRGQSTREYLERRLVAKASSDIFELGLAFDDPGTPLVRAAAKAGFPLSLIIAADLVRNSEDGRVYETFRNRLIFPIKDVTGRVVGFGGRTLADHQAKYINTRQTLLFDKGRGLYGVHLARESMTREGRAILVEGFMDCLAVHQAGLSETVASLGTALTDSQVELLRRYCDVLFLLFDSDRAGAEAAERAIQLVLPKGMRVRMARIPDGKDPADFLSHHGPQAFRDVLNASTDALEFKWLQTLSRYGAEETNARRGEAVADFVRIMAAVFETGAVDAIQRGLLVNQVSHLLKMDRAEVVALIERHKPGRPASTAARGPSAGPQSSRTQTTEQPSAWCRFLGAVLNEPGLLTTANPLPDIRLIADERDRRLAGMVLDRAAELGEFCLTDVLVQCHDPQDVQRLTELAEQGARSGNPEGTFRIALERLRRDAGEDAFEQSAQKLRGGTEDPVEAGKVAEHLSVVGDGMKRHRHFAPRRMIRRVVGTAAAKPDSARPQLS